MGEKRICSLPGIRCDEGMHIRVREAAKHLGMTPTAFIFAAIVEKLHALEAEWIALNSIFNPEAPGNGSNEAQQGVTNYRMYDDEEG